MKYTEIEMEELSEKLDKKSMDLVPIIGNASTLAGEIVRATEQLLCRFLNDGDRVFVLYGSETCNAPFRFLQNKLECESEEIKYALDNLQYSSDESYEEYEEALFTLVANVLDYLEKHLETEETENEDDFWNYVRPEDQMWYNEEENEEE